MRINHWWAALVLLTAAGAATVSAEEIALARENNVNIRAQPAFSGEIIARLKKGAEVMVLEEITLDKPKPGEPARWARIRYPTNAHVWVYSVFIDPADKTVIAKRLNLRAGPSENYSVVGRLEHGTVVKELGAKGDWLEIEPPPDAAAFVAADLLEKKPVAPVPVETPAVPPAVAPPVTLTPTPPPQPKPSPGVVPTPTPAVPPPEATDIQTPNVPSTKPIPIPPSRTPVVENPIPDTSAEVLT